MDVDVSKILDYLEESVLPGSVSSPSELPEAYRAEVENEYQSRVRRRARKLLQSADPKVRRSVLAFFEQEEEIRGLIEEIKQRKRRLEELGFDDRGVEFVNEMQDRLVDQADELAEKAHRSVVGDNEMVGLFTGDRSEARPPGRRGES
jgi:hypothetical protein